MPGSFSLIFDSAVSGHANSYIVNNVSRALVDRLTVKFAEIIAQDNDVYDLYKFYEDLLLTENERASIFREVIQSFERSDATLKIRRNQEFTIRISSIVYQNKYRIPSWDFEGSWSLPKSSFWWASFRVETCTCQQCCNRIWQDSWPMNWRTSTWVF